MTTPLRYRRTTRKTNRINVLFHCFTGACPFCGGQLAPRYDTVGPADFYKEEFHWQSYVCPACGWWWHGAFPEHSYSVGTSVFAVLHEGSSVPEELERAVAAIRDNTDRLFEMHPTKFEQFVGDILRAFYACEVVHCGKSHDGGIDLVLTESDAGRVPIQVKRRAKPQSVESVAVVRDFRGALLLQGQSRGKIVTTAHHFSPEAIAASVPQPHHLAPQEIDLVDCRRLLDIMQLICSSTREHHEALTALPNFDFVEPDGPTMASIETELADFRSKLTGL